MVYSSTVIYKYIYNDDNNIAQISFLYRCLTDFFVGRQKHVRLYPLPALDGQQLEGVVEVQESKGAQVFAWGSIRVSALNGLCVAVKKKVYVYELYNTLKHKKIKEIVTQREAQWMGVFNGKLCVGYTSGFILYSVQGEGQATSKSMSVARLVVLVSNRIIC